MNEKEKTVYRIREFHRFYLPTFDLLGNHYLGSDYSATESRVLFEIYSEDGCNAAYIAKKMRIDKSYLSRIIKRHERDGYIERTVSQQDSRSFNLHLTESGMEKTEDLIEKSNEQIREMIQTLNVKKCKQLREALNIVTEILEECEI